MDNRRCEESCGYAVAHRPPIDANDCCIHFVVYWLLALYLLTVFLLTSGAVKKEYVVHALVAHFAASGASILTVFQLRQKRRWTALHAATAAAYAASMLLAAILIMQRPDPVLAASLLYVFMALIISIP
jgi:hypothetical protein